MERKIFDKIRDIVYEHSGISLSDQKDALVCARVSKRMRMLKIQTHSDYLKYLEKDDSGRELVNLLDAISTNVTSFFRESNHFDFMGKVFEEWQAKGQKKFRFWSAASSTGEEPYTMAMTVLKHLKDHSIDIKILATDINTEVLNKCHAGIYHEDKVKSIPKNILNTYFTKHLNDDFTTYKVKESLRSMVTFKRLNLSKPPFPMRGPMDIIFCRNVMIYFDNAVRLRFLNEAHRLLRPGGYLIVGHAESLTGIISNKFKVIQPAIYLKK